LKKLLLNLYFWPLFALLTVVSLLLLPGLIVVNNLFLPRPQAACVRRLIRVYGWLVLHIVPFGAPRIRVLDRAFQDQPVVFVANHASAVDPFLFGLLPVENAFITSWPFTLPIFRRVMIMAEYIHSNDGWPRIASKAARLLRSGCSLIIWPEGHRSLDGRVQRFKKGAFQIAAENGCPVVPVVISESGTLLPPGRLFLNPARPEISVLAPIKLSAAEAGSPEAAAILRNRARKIIEETLAPKGDQPNGGEEVTKQGLPQWRAS